ncbi:MAG: DUF4105 domain-containing protein [Chthoniobacterales bacterium]
MKILRNLLLGGFGVVLALWAFGALWFDAMPAAACGFFAAVIAAMVVLRRSGRAWLVPFAGFVMVLAWWLTLAPSHQREWAVEYSKLPRAAIDGDKVTISNLRDFEEPANGDAIARWDTRTYNLADIEGMDLAINYWGSPWLAHPIVIFRFRNAPPLAFSIETRREKGETYSALGGFFRQYELIVLAGDERDFLGGRVNRGEDIYLYATTATPERARARLLDYLETINALDARPRWYNAVTSNCTTAIRGMNNHGPKLPLDWRLLINGKGDDMLYEGGYLRTEGLPFAALKQRALINSVAREAFQSGDFSGKIRAGRPEFAAGS